LGTTVSRGRRPGSCSQVDIFSPRWRVDSSARGESLAAHLARQLLIPESEASDLIDFGSAHVDGKVTRDPSRRVSENEEICVYLPWNGPRHFYEIDQGRILYRDDYLLAYNKESGIPSQQTPSDVHNNLYAALLRHLKKEGPQPPYLALHHRLDKETSGVMLFATDRSVNRRMGKAFEQHGVKKEYLAWVGGNPSRKEWTVTDDIGRSGGRYRVTPKGQGKDAETFFEVVSRGDDSLIRARPLTGRTHQIRLHLKASGHPVVGDILYGGKRAKRLFLHAYRLTLRHPVYDSELSLTAPIPDDWPVLN
jgi:23S rRNA pseudouridine1911/1915/1917 synthase